MSDTLLQSWIGALFLVVSCFSSAAPAAVFTPSAGEPTRRDAELIPAGEAFSVRDVISVSFSGEGSSAFDRACPFALTGGYPKRGAAHRALLIFSSPHPYVRTPLGAVLSQPFLRGGGVKTLTAHTAVFGGGGTQDVRGGDAHCTRPNISLSDRVHSPGDQTFVVRDVCSVGAEKEEVGYTVIGSILVDVMNSLPVFQVSTEYLLYDEDMFRNFTEAVCARVAPGDDFDIPIVLHPTAPPISVPPPVEVWTRAPSTPLSVASHVTKLDGTLTHPPLRYLGHFAAILTDYFDQNSSLFRLVTGVYYG